MADEEAVAPAAPEDDQQQQQQQPPEETAPSDEIPAPSPVPAEPSPEPPIVESSQEVVEEHSAVTERKVEAHHSEVTSHKVVHQEESRSSSSMSMTRLTSSSSSVLQQHFSSLNHHEEVAQEQATMLTAWPPVRSPTPRNTLDVQTIDLTLNKEEGQHWGFRLGGGKEFSTPLSVNRVQLGGLAEQQGFRVGDVVEQINGMSTAEMSHNEALEAVRKSGNKCLFTIIRNVAATGRVPKPFQTMAPLQDLTIAQPAAGVKPALASPIAAKAAMRSVALGQVNQLNAEQAETCFTEEVIAETMTSHAEIVAGNALGVNFHKFEPKYEHLALSSVYQLLLEEESRRGRAMTLPRPRKPEIVPKKQQPPPKEPNPPTPPPPKEPTPPPKEPTPPPKEPTPPPKELTPPPEEPEEALVPEEEPEYLEAEQPTEEHLTNGVNGLDEEDEELAAAAAAAAEEEAELARQAAAQAEAEAQAAAEAAAAAEKAAREAEAKAYYQRQHEERLSRERKEALEAQLAQKMKMEECRRRINHAQKSIYAPTITPEETVVTDCTTGIERKLPKAGCRYRPALPLTAAASMHTAFPTKAEAFQPFQAKAPPVFQPTSNGVQKPLAKPASAVQCVIPMNWHPPSQLVNGQPYKYQPTQHMPAKQLPDQEFLPPAEQSESKPASKPQQQLEAEPPKQEPRPRSPMKPVAHPLQPVPEVAKPNATGPQLSEDEIAEMMSASAEVIVGQTIGVNFQKFMPGFDHLQNSAVYRMVHGLED